MPSSVCRRMYSHGLGKAAAEEKERILVSFSHYWHTSASLRGLRDTLPLCSLLTLGLSLSPIARPPFHSPAAQTHTGSLTTLLARSLRSHFARRKVGKMKFFKNREYRRKRMKEKPSGEEGELDRLGLGTCAPSTLPSSPSSILYNSVCLYCTALAFFPSFPSLFLSSNNNNTRFFHSITFFLTF